MNLTAGQMLLLEVLEEMQSAISWAEADRNPSSCAPGRSDEIQKRIDALRKHFESLGADTLNERGGTL